MPQQIPDRKLWASLLAATNGEVPATANVFISYAREDGQFVGHLCGALREAGYTPWLDRESIPGSSEWLVEINKGIDNAGAVIVVLSPAACASRFVEQELQYAQKSNRPVVPLQFQQCQLSYGMLWLGQRQYVDLTNDTFLGALQRLDQSLKQLGLVPSPPRREPEPLPQLSQVILGTWEIEMTFQQRSYRTPGHSGPPFFIERIDLRAAGDCPIAVQWVMVGAGAERDPLQRPLDGAFEHATELVAADFLHPVDFQ